MMAKATFIYNTPSKSIGGIVVDAFIQENYEFRNEVTEIPVEEGVTVTDNVVGAPDEISVTGFFSKYSSEENGAVDELELKKRGMGNPMQRAKQYYNDLVNLKKKREPVTLVTGLDTFDDMIITSLSIPREVNIGSNLQFTMTLKKLPIVSSKTTAVSAAPATSASSAIEQTSETGVQATQEAQPNELQQWYKKQVEAGNVTPAEYAQRWGSMPF